MARLAEELLDDLASDALVLLSEGYTSRAFCDEIRRVLTRCNRLEHVMWRFLADNHFHAWLDDACLVSRDLVNCVAEGVDMVQANRGYGANEGCHDVRRVNEAAHSDLKDNDVAFSRLIVHEGHQSRDLEEGQAQRERHGCLRHAIKERNDAVFTDHFPIDLNSLPEAADVRRGKKSGSETSCLERCSGLEAYGAFSISARYMDDLVGILWVTKCAAYFAHII